MLEKAVLTKIMIRRRKTKTGSSLLLMARSMVSGMLMSTVIALRLFTVLNTPIESDAQAAMAATGAMYGTSGGMSTNAQPN